MFGENKAVVTVCKSFFELLPDALVRIGN
jgi:hypothetical protein